MELAILILNLIIFVQISLFMFYIRPYEVREISKFPLPLALRRSAHKAPPKWTSEEREAQLEEHARRDEPRV